MQEPELSLPRGPLFLHALRAAVGRVPLWLLTWSVPFLAAVALALPWVAWFGETTAHRYEPGSVLGGMDEVFRFDHRVGLADLRRTGATTGATLSLVLMLFGAYAAGGWLQVFLERTSGHSLRRFFWGGAKYFWRFVRVLLLSLAGLSLLTWLVHGWPWKTLVLSLLLGSGDEGIEALDSELSVARLEWLQSGLYALGFTLLLAWGDYTRTRLALHGTRSALWAGIATGFLILRHPVQTLRPLLFLFAVEAFFVIGLGAASWDANAEIGPATTWKALVSLALLGQLALLWQTISRGARYFATVHVSRRLVAPLPKPDPWARRIGGPGGPQYPIDDTDDYGVSI